MCNRFIVHTYIVLVGSAVCINCCVTIDDPMKMSAVGLSLLFAVSSLLPFSESSFYSLSVEDTDGSSTSLEKYSGKVS